MDQIPTDIIYFILYRLPAKSIQNLVRVSKSWANIIRSNYFINLFTLQQNPHQFRLLFAFNKIKESSKNKNNWSFFNLINDEKEKPIEFISTNSCAQVRASQFNDESSLDPPIYVNGLLSFTCGKNTQIISNPSTGKSIVLPLVRSKREILSRFFGFDPIKGEYKVLCIVSSMYGSGCRVRIEPTCNQVLTVGFNGLWREIDVWIPHRPRCNGVCIDGIIYYLALVGELELIVVRFDVRLEKFLKELPCLFLQPKQRFLTLINYESKLGINHAKPYAFDLWILEDVEKNEWLKISIDVNQWRCFSCRFDIKILGTSSCGEIVYTCYGPPNENFYVIYYDYKKNRHRRVLIREEDRGGNDSTSYVGKFGFVDYVESVMLL